MRYNTNMGAQHTRNNHRSKSSCPEGWTPAGYSVPLRLTVRQEHYCRRAIGITRFIYNLCVATHRFCRTNRLPWTSWQDLYKAFNACKREDYPFVTEVASRVQEGAFMDFGAALRNWRDPSYPAGPPVSGRGAGRARGHSGQRPVSYSSGMTASDASGCR